MTTTAASTDAGQGDVDLDLYADVEGGEFSHEGGYEDVQQENGADIFDDVIVSSANNDFPDLNGHVAGVGSSSSLMGSKPLVEPPMSALLGGQNHTGKRVSCYVGNLTWWTTDQDLNDAINSLGVTDLVEIKFYENKINGQSKGFAVVTVGSDTSFRTLMDKLPGNKLHGQSPAVTYFSKHNLNQFEAQARKDLPNDQSNRTRNMPSNVPGLPLARPGGILPRPGMPPGLAQQQMGQMQGMPRAGMQPGLQPRPPLQHMRLGATGMPGMNSAMNRGALMPNPNGQGLLRGPPPGHRLPGGPDLRGAQPRPDWDRQGHGPGFQQQQQGPRGGVPPNVQHGGPGQHMNPAYFQMGQGAPQNGLPHQLHHPNHGPGPHGQIPPGHQYPPGQHHENPYYRPNERQDMFVGQMSESEFLDIIEKNRMISMKAINDASNDAKDGNYANAIETLVMAKSLIKNSNIANDDRCKILIDSLEDTLKRIINEDKYYSSGKGRSDSRDSRERARRSRSRDSRERESRKRDKHRHRSRSRDRRDYYEDTRYHRSRH